tara:strand:- start:512 stop:784 length:273 start_codon:yes stop_codon:yes gene_type:complete
MIKLKTILEKFDSKAQQRFLYATDPKAAKEKGEKMTKKDYEELPDKVNEISPGPFGITMAIGVILKALLKWYQQANSSDKKKLKKFVDDL